MLPIGSVRNTQDRMQRSRYAHNATLGRRAGIGSAVGRQIGAMTRWFRFYPRAGLRTGARSACGGGKEGRGRTDGDGKNPGCHKGD